MNWPEQIYIVHHAEEVLDSNYDSFFWKKKRKKKPKKTVAQKAASKEKRQAFWGKLGQGVQSAGGAEGILGTVTNVFSFLKGGSSKTGEKDFKGSLRHVEERNPGKSAPMVIWIVGGVAVLAIGGYLYTQNQKKQQAALLAAATQQ